MKITLDIDDELLVDTEVELRPAKLTDRSSMAADGEPVPRRQYCAFWSGLSVCDHLE
jgi:hypothetical protein